MTSPTLLSSLHRRHIRPFLQLHIVRLLGFGLKYGAAARRGSVVEEEGWAAEGGCREAVIVRMGQQSCFHCAAKSCFAANFLVLRGQRLFEFSVVAAKRLSSVLGW